MRTTVSISDDVLARARRRASDRSVTLSQVVEEALRSALVAHDPGPPPEVAVFRGRRGVVDGVDLTSNAALADVLDDDVPLDQRR
jgi:hypothetical protein